jgi:hypothetical protein
MRSSPVLQCPIVITQQPYYVIAEGARCQLHRIKGWFAEKCCITLKHTYLLQWERRAFKDRGSKMRKAVASEMVKVLLFTYTEGGHDHVWMYSTNTGTNGKGWALTPLSSESLLSASNSSKCCKPRMSCISVKLCMLSATAAATQGLMPHLQQLTIRHRNSAPITNTPFPTACNNLFVACMKTTSEEFCPPLSSVAAFTAQSTQVEPLTSGMFTAKFAQHICYIFSALHGTH